MKKVNNTSVLVEMLKKQKDNKKKEIEELLKEVEAEVGRTLSNTEKTSIVMVMSDRISLAKTISLLKLRDEVVRINFETNPDINRNEFYRLYKQALNNN